VSEPAPAAPRSGTRAVATVLEISAPPRADDEASTPPAPTSGRHFVRTIFAFFVGQGVSWIGSAVLAVVLPRFLGDVGLGKFGFAMALVLLVGLLANLGTSTYLMKELARDPSRAPLLTGNALLMRIPLVLVAASSAVAATLLVHADATTRVLVFVLCGWILLDSARGVVQGALQGLHLMRPLAVYPAVSNSIFMAAATWLALIGTGPVGVGVGFLIGQAVAVAINVWSLVRVVRPVFRLDRGVCLALLTGGLPFFVWQAALVIYGQIDAVLLSVMTGDAVVGWYVAAYRIVTVGLFVPTILMTVLFPTLAGAVSRREEFSAVANRALQAVMVATVPMSLGIMILAPALVRVLGYPDSFSHSVLPIVLLAPGFPLVAVDMIIGTILNASDRQRAWAVAAVAAAVINPTLNVFAIKITDRMLHNGAVGAAAVTTLTEVLLMIVGIALLPRGSVGRVVIGRAIRCVAAGLVMVAVVIPLRDLPIVIPVAAGGVVYAAAAVAFGALSLADLREILLHLRPRLQALGSTA
jgi:O-antigen/teichoic acid export membrane protein